MSIITKKRATTFKKTASRQSNSSYFIKKKIYDIINETL